MDEDRDLDRDDIARRAYRRYEERGRAGGSDQADWFEAEREAREGARKSPDDATSREESVVGGGATRGRRARGRTVDRDTARASGTGPTSTPTGAGPSGDVRTPGHGGEREAD